MSISRYWVAVFALVVASAAPVHAQQAASSAGRIKVVSGAAFIVRDSKLIPAQIGQDVYTADALRTGGDGRIAKLAPDSIRLETPAAIVGVRGTTLAILVGP